ncbi:MAG: methylmalonyl Co-A mutase-associated GTPase MeaB, partial [Bacteroidia bacterium]|nr:methylmalonyl Co-A mutase-associated GTPase MeaB [Bacteroidia bacterium]
LLESSREDDRRLAAEILASVGRAPEYCVGFTGAPGAGKSTLVEAAGIRFVETGRKLAVLAVDPSGVRTGGSVLGDKTRMSALAAHPLAFIRPSPSGGTPGGLHLGADAAVLLCAAAGYHHVWIETVGVGQTEVDVFDVADVFVLVLQPGAGDELQGLKRGVVELADVIVVNKADGERRRAALQTARDYQAALSLFPARQDGWKTPVVVVSALQSEGLDALFERLEAFKDLRRRTGAWERRRAEGRLKRFRENAFAALKRRWLAQNPTDDLDQKVWDGVLPAYCAVVEYETRLFAAHRNDERKLFGA